MNIITLYTYSAGKSFQQVDFINCRGYRNILLILLRPTSKLAQAGMRMTYIAQRSVLMRHYRLMPEKATETHFPQF